MRRAILNPAASGTDTAFVAAAPGKRIRVLQVVAIAGGTATDLTFNSKGSGAGTAVSPKFANGANGGAVLPFNKAGWFETNLGEALTVTTGGGSATGVMIGYELI